MPSTKMNKQPQKKEQNHEHYKQKQMDLVFFCGKVFMFFTLTLASHAFGRYEQPKRVNALRCLKSNIKFILLINLLFISFSSFIRFFCHKPIYVIIFAVFIFFLVSDENVSTVFSQHVTNPLHMCEHQR